MQSPSFYISHMCYSLMSRLVITNHKCLCLCVSGFLRDLCELLLYLLLPPGDFHNKNMRYFLRVSTHKIHKHKPRAHLHITQNNHNMCHFTGLNDKYDVHKCHCATLAVIHEPLLEYYFQQQAAESDTLL